MAENNIASAIKQDPAFDEQRLAKVLEAAYVLQEHNRERQERESVRREAVTPRSAADLDAKPPQPITSFQAPPQNRTTKTSPDQDFTLVLAKIVETQRQIQAENLDQEAAMLLITERAMQIARAAGAAIGIHEDGKVCYGVVAGAMALPAGTTVRTEKALCSACLRVGQVIRCGSVNLEFLVDAGECARRGIESLIAAPIHHGGSVIGALELYYGEPQSFTEPDVHACQLMAGLAGEVLARSEGMASKKSLQVERAAMRDALEKLKPNLEALVEPSDAENSSSGLNPSALKPLAHPDALISRCGKCGSELHDEEVFCGTCGLPRNTEPAIASMQSKVAMLWQMQEQKNKSAVRNPSNDDCRFQPFVGAFRPSMPEDLCETTMPELEDLLAPPPVTKFPAESLTNPYDDNAVLLHGNLAPQDAMLAAVPAENTPFQPVTGAAIVKTLPRPNWTSAAAAREFLERVAHENRNHAILRFLKARRGDVYLALAIILVACVIRWGVWDGSGASSGAPVTAAHRNVNADLSLFDRMLIKLGLADPPDPPLYKGNPKTQVWVDEQTALYYCPGSDLYGKTPKGRMTIQRDAQLDQYEPALRKACD